MTPSARSDVLAKFPPAYPIIDPSFLRKIGLAPLEMARCVAEAGIRVAQYRYKGDFDADAFREAAEVVAELQAAGVCCVVNDRADIALAVGADGVHVGQQDIPPWHVRRIVGSDMILGYSTHSVAQANDDQCEWADYLAVGPVFDTASKQNADPVVGLEGVLAARSVTRKPLVAIGGITLSNCAKVLRAGADSVAAISAVTPENLPSWAGLSR